MFFYSLNVMPWDLATRRVLKPGDQINPVFYNFFNAFFSFNTSNLYPENKFVCFVLFFFVCLFVFLINCTIKKFKTNVKVHPSAGLAQ